MMARAIFKTSLDQWYAYMTPQQGGYYAATQHDVYFTSVLGPDAITQWDTI